MAAILFYGRLHRAAVVDVVRTRPPAIPLAMVMGVRLSELRYDAKTNIHIYLTMIWAPAPD